MQVSMNLWDKNPDVITFANNSYHFVATQCKFLAKWQDGAEVSFDANSRSWSVLLILFCSQRPRAVRLAGDHISILPAASVDQLTVRLWSSEYRVMR
jgi:hypothetical protein